MELYIGIGNLVLLVLFIIYDLAKRDIIMDMKKQLDGYGSRLNVIYEKVKDPIIVKSEPTYRQPKIKFNGDKEQPAN